MVKAAVFREDNELFFLSSLSFFRNIVIIYLNHCDDSLTIL